MQENLLDHLRVFDRGYDLHLPLAGATGVEIWSMLFEVGTRHSPSEQQLQQIVRENLPGLRRMMAEAPVARAPRHAFNGRCQVRLLSDGTHFDLRRE